MSQTKDPAIKLFGRNISVPDAQIPAKRPFKNKCSDITEGETVNLSENNSVEPDKSTVTAQAIKDSQIEGSHSSMPREEQAESSSTTEQEKFKKPDKIIPCPRCNSLDTKFCYFNNYNVNQPRHFCKNCQRYWTAGGTMRNVPIGAGRRKNKHLVSQYRQILVSPEGVPIARVENTENSENHQMVSSPEPSNGSRVLKFTSESPLCDSMEKTLSLGEQKKTRESEASDSVDVPKSANEVNGPVTYCYPVPPPWLFPWAPHNGPNNSAVPIIAVPGFCPPSIPVQLVPASYLNCIPVLPSNGSYVCPSPSSSTSTSCCSGNGSPKLGKHSRDSNHTDEEKGENCVVVPKKLRIDDPNEGSRGPLWGTLGRKNEQKMCVSNGSVFKSCETKAEGKSRETEAGPILEANPAALSRANTFQESS